MYLDFRIQANPIHLDVHGAIFRVAVRPSVRRKRGNKKRLRCRSRSKKPVLAQDQNFNETPP